MDIAIVAPLNPHLTCIDAVSTIRIGTIDCACVERVSFRAMGRVRGDMQLLWPVYSDNVDGLLGLLLSAHLHEDRLVFTKIVDGRLERKGGSPLFEAFRHPIAIATDTPSPTDPLRFRDAMHALLRDHINPSLGIPFLLVHDDLVQKHVYTCRSGADASLLVAALECVLGLYGSGKGRGRINLTCGTDDAPETIVAIDGVTQEGVSTITRLVERHGIHGTYPVKKRHAPAQSMYEGDFDRKPWRMLVVAREDVSFLDCAAALSALEAGTRHGN